MNSYQASYLANVGLNPPPQRQANTRQLGADPNKGGITNTSPHAWGEISNRI